MDQPTQHRDGRVSATLWCAGLAAFAVMYAPQGLLTEIAGDTGVDASQASLLVSAATFGLAASVLPWARLAGRLGLRNTLRVSAIGASVSALAVPLLPSFEAITAGRLVQGITLGGIPALAMALPHDTATPRRAAALGASYVAATSLGGLSGRLAVVPIADHLGWRPALFVLGCLVTVLMVTLVLVIPETSSGTSGVPSAGVVRHHLRDPVMLCLFVIGGVLIGGMVIVFNYLPFRLEQAPYLLSPTTVSMIFLVYLAGTAASRVGGWLAGRVGEVAVLTVAGLLMAAGVVVTLAGPLAVLLCGVTILTVGLFMGHAVASSMVAARASAGRAQATSLYNIAYYAGSSVFGWVGGLAWIHGQWALVTMLVAVLGVIASTAAIVLHRQPGSARGGVAQDLLQPLERVA